MSNFDVTPWVWLSLHKFHGIFWVWCHSLRLSALNLPEFHGIHWSKIRIFSDASRKIVFWSYFVWDNNLKRISFRFVEADCQQLKLNNYNTLADKPNWRISYFLLISESQTLKETVRWCFINRKFDGLKCVHWSAIFWCKSISDGWQLFLCLIHIGYQDTISYTVNIYIHGQWANLHNSGNQFV